MSREIYNWLKDSNPWTDYITRRDLLNESDKELKSYKELLLKEPLIVDSINELKSWYPQSYTRHNDAKISHYKLMTLAQMGINKDDPGMDEVISAVKEHMDSGLYAMRQSLPDRGGDLSEGWHALPCDSPVILYSLLLLGDRSEESLKSVQLLHDKWLNPTGWFCDFFFVKGQFKKHNAPCPMAGLMALQVFSLFDEYRNSKAADNAFNSLVYHRDLKDTLYFFGRSKKFWTFKYPFVWYNALYMADVVTKYDRFLDSDLTKELISWVLESMDDEGKIKPTSMFRNYKGWDFADKKSPSPWITMLCYRILKRLKS